MRVLVLSTWFPYPPDNGSKIRAHYLVRALGEKHEVTLVAFRPSGAVPATLPRNVNVIEVAEDPFRHVKLPAWTKYASPIPMAFWPSREMQHTIKEIVSTRRFDAVVAIQTPVAQYAASIPGIPRVIDIDTSFSYQMHQRYSHSTRPGSRLRAWLSWQKTQYYEQRVFQKFQVYAVASHLEVDFIAAMIKEGGGCVEVIGNGVDCEQYRPGQYLTRPNTLIYSGALTYSANYDAMCYFLSAIYPHLHRQGAEVSLTITGSTAGIDRSGLRLDNSVHFSGYVDDIRPEVGSCAVCVIPLRQGSGTRLKILEAMALGVPVVSTHKGAEGLAVIDGEHLLIADDPIEFAAKTQLALHDTALRERLITQARRLVEQTYDWRMMGQQFVQLIEAAASNPGRR